MSSSFYVSNGVRQGGDLSPFLFSVYINDLSRLLNNLRAGCYVGNSCINHIFLADDICLMSPSLAGLQDLIDVCSAYAKVNDIVFNCNKSYAMLCAPRYFSLSCMPVLRLGSDATISFVNSVRYLGVQLNSNLFDDDDILRQVRFLYGTGNKLKYRFSKCSSVVKNTSFHRIVQIFMRVTYGVIIVLTLSESCVLLIMTRIEFCIIYLVASVLGSAKFLPMQLLSLL